MTGHGTEERRARSRCHGSGRDPVLNAHYDLQRWTDGLFSTWSSTVWSWLADRWFLGSPLESGPRWPRAGLGGVVRSCGRSLDAADRAPFRGPGPGAQCLGSGRGQRLLAGRLDRLGGRRARRGDGAGRRAGCLPRRGLPSRGLRRGPLASEGPPPASRMLSAPRRRWGCQSRGHWVSSCSSSVRASRPRRFWSAARLSGDLAQAMTRRPSRMSSRSWESMYHCGLAFLVDPV